MKVFGCMCVGQHVRLVGISGKPPASPSGKTRWTWRWTLAISVSRKAPICRQSPTTASTVFWSTSSKEPHTWRSDTSIASFSNYTLSQLWRIDPCTHGTSPTYLQSCFTRVADMTSRRRLRSYTSHRLDVPPVRLSTVGKRAFPVSGATVWNDLPLHVASAPSLAVFRQRLTTFLSSRFYKGAITWLMRYN